MLSASTFSSSSSAFSASPGVSTPSSQYSNDSRRGNHNPLTELIETEQTYMETLKMIDSQIAPIWMKQMTSAAPDFSELLKHVHDILIANKRFCLRLTKIASNPQAIGDLGDALMQWVNELEVPYGNYSRSYIHNLNQRQDILQNPAISNLLKNLSSNVSYEINLESLFNAPIQQLKYYKGLYGRLLESTDSGRADHKLLINANKRIDTIMMLSQNGQGIQKNNFGDGNGSSAPALPLIQTNLQPSANAVNPDLTAFERQVDCSRTVDLLSGAQINYQLHIAHTGADFVMRDSFIMISDDNGPSIRVHIFLTTAHLVICRELTPTQFLLLYPAISVNDVTVKSESLDREIVGEYMIRFIILGKKHIVVRADSKGVRNTWVGVDHDAPSAVTLSPRPLATAVDKNLGNKPKFNDAGKGGNVRNTDIFTYYSEAGGVSPLSDEEEDFPDWKKKDQGKSRDTIMDFYDDHLNDFEADEEEFPLPPLPPVKQAPPASNNESSHVQMTFIEPPTAQMSTMAIAPPVPQHQNNELNNKSSPTPLSSSSPNTSSPGMNINKINPSSQSPGNGMKNFDGRPSSPRNIEVQRAVIPEVMQAVTQNTDEYISSNIQKQQQPLMPNGNIRPILPRSDSVALPRTSSINKQNPNYPNQQRPPMNNFGQPQSPIMNQQRPPMNNYGPPLSPIQHQAPLGQKPLPNQPPTMMNNNQPRPNMMMPGPYGNNRPMMSPPPHQQQFRPGPPPPQSPMGYNNNRPLPPNPMRNAPGSPLLQQPPRFNSSPSLGQNQLNKDDMGPPPHSPTAYNPGNDIRKILYSSSQCQVFHWKDQSWYAAEGQCLLQIRLAHNNCTCVAVQLQNTGQLYLNAWILPNTVIRQPSPTDVNISLFMGNKKENYLIHFNHPQDANVFADILHKAHAESNVPIPTQSDLLPEQDEPEPVDNVNVPQTLKPVMQCKAKLFIKNETNNWSTFGSVSMRISQQAPSMRMMIQIENDKTKLVSAIVRSGNVERISPKRISFLLADEASKTSIVYMIHLREDQTGNKIYEYLRTKNAENGW